MEEDVCSISGMFGANIIEEAEKGVHNYGLVRRASVRFFRSIKQAHRSISGSLSSLISRQSSDTENTSQSKEPEGSKVRRRRSFAFGEEFKVFSTPPSIGKISFLFH